MSNTFDQFDELLPPSKGTLTSDTEAHALLSENVPIALKLHRQAMEYGLPGPAADNRLALEAANATVKAALTTDRTALKARSEKTLERVLLRLLFIRKQRGAPLSIEDAKLLKTAPRAELEAALGPKIVEYDQMEKANAG